MGDSQDKKIKGSIEKSQNSTHSETSQGSKSSEKQVHEDYYFNEEGLLVFTREYHLKRGYCCKNGCKHCPY